ncbi:uncharacterized protein N7518_003541 [Penicillium psychrosexuale]|uniref:uncharacterized protein n=1 Tax=Penicillium psychrosexuale TaxID=1002107 RepID=UPI00254537AC|nr:uncharacterized protein N7518_003541 [Penicillium psychrosexuale]KAJ5801473.1 hypothetical protein N7518_003541 [Penicillium psychrosexuale]
MATNLPPELLIQIAKLLKDDDASLAPCTSVCRSWQMAFEPLLYSELLVYSDEDHKEEEPLGMSLTKFQKLTSGSHAIRRSWIRKLQYDIFVPFKISDWITQNWNTRKKKDEEDYSTSNPTKEPNVLAFQTAMASLFQTLSSWGQTGCLTLQLRLEGYRLGEYYEECAGIYAYSYTDGSQKEVPPYLVRFADVGSLSHVPCIDKLFLSTTMVRIIKSGPKQRKQSSNTVQMSQT